MRGFIAEYNGDSENMYPDFTDWFKKYLKKCNN